MEILMKLKCAASTPNTVPKSTLKVVDHHRQLQQHNARRMPTHPGAPNFPMPPQDLMMPGCIEFTNGMDCCGSSNLSRPNGLEYGSRMYNTPPPCCSGIGTTPICCSGINYEVTSPPLLSQHSAVPLSHSMSQNNNIPMNLSSTPASEARSSYEYTEPEENFVSIDDAKVKGFLLRFGQEQAAKERSKRKIAAPPASITYEIIDLDDEDDQEKLKEIRNQPNIPTPLSSMSPPPLKRRNREQNKSPDISLIPKSPDVAIPKSTSSAVASAPAPKEKILAQIDLVDSSDSESNMDDDGMTLAAATVSCELQCDENDEDTITDSIDEPPIQEIITLPSEDENLDYINEQEEGPELRWEELEEQKERNTFECYLCGKTVLSSYNLRRHMMIHTGERPFSCDMCERRFREFSDLKKHRRRHAKEPNFVCMICHDSRPAETDPTRCLKCLKKNETIAASSRATAPPSPEVTQPPPAIVKKPTRGANYTPNMTPPPLLKAATKPPASNSLPPLVPLNNSSSTKKSSSDKTQAFLDNIPAVHRPSYNKNGVVTRREYPCPLCQRPFGTRHNLKRHFMIHTGEKPFVCVHCRKPFREYSTLKKHMTTHQRDRWYRCLRCPQKFRDYLLYMEHKAKHPGEETSSSNAIGGATSKKRARTKCNYDDNSYDSNEDDSMSEDWLECCECGQRFTEIETFTEHLKEHDQHLMLFECYICKETFEEQEKLLNHMKVKHSERYMTESS